MYTYDLTPRYDSRASFYGKARVTEIGDTLQLTSYNTLVATIQSKFSHETNQVEKIAKVNSTHSQTTLRHIKEFLKQNGFRADSKAQIIKDYGVKA